MKKIIICLLLIMSLLVITACKSTTNNTTSTTTQFEENQEYVVTVYTTTGSKSKLLEKQADLIIKKQESTNPTTIEIDDKVLYQEMDGFGAALTESSAYLINSMPEHKRREVINELFSSEGIGMSFVRLPMGASDFALSSYTYNDIPNGETDPTLSKFSIARDKEHVIPILKEAFKLNNEIKLMGSPWSAPAWMKTNGSLNGGSIKGEYLSVYSDYFVKFIEEYQKEGLPIYAVTLQNEPLHEINSYPTMKMTSGQQAYFIKQLGPKFNENKISTKIIAYDHNWDQTAYPLSILRDPEANKYVAGSAFHCYGGEVTKQKALYEQFKDKGIWFTECSGGDWAKNFSDNISWNMENIFMGSINNYSKSVLLWNIALDQNNGPKNGGCQDCRGVLTIHDDGTYRKNEEYYMIGHFSKFVNPGAYRIESKITGNQNLIASSFINPNGEIVMVLHNKVSQNLKVTLNYNGLSTDFTVLGKSTNTLIINK